MFTKISWALVLAVVGALPSAAGADQASPAKPLRHLRYTASVFVYSMHESDNYYGHFDQPAGNVTALGSIDANVVGLAPDNALVFQVSENTDRRPAPAVKVGVLKLGQVTFDPKDAPNLNDEEQALLSLLGRGVVADHDLGVNMTWSTDNSGGNVTDKTTYRVKDLVGDDQVNLDYERDVKVSGSQPYDAVTTGTVLYDYKRSVPISAKLKQHAHSGDTNSRLTTDMSFQFDLATDSLAQAGGSN